MKRLDLLLGLLCLGVVNVTQAASLAGDGGAATITLESVEVTGSAIPTSDESEGQMPVNVNVVNSDDFHDRQVANTASALRYAPGVMANSNNGGNDERISIRGSNLSATNYDNAGVIMLRDGLPVSSADGANHNRLINPYAASEIVVANGANALTSGASALGGSLNYVSRTALNSDPNQINLGVGSDSHYRGGASVGGVSETLDGILMVDGQHYTGFRHHSQERQRSVLGNVGWLVSERLKLRFFGTHINSQQQLSGALTRDEVAHHRHQAAASYVQGNHQLNVETSRGAIKGSWDISAASQLEFGVSHEHQSLYHPIVTSPFFSLLIDTEQDTTAGMLRYRHQFQSHRFEAGLNLATTRNRGANYENNAGHRGARSENIDQRAKDATLFLLDQWAFAPRWTLVAAAQTVVTSRDSRSTDLSSGDRRHQQKTYSTLNPRLGLIYALSDNSDVYANVSRVYQAPNNFELDNDLRNNDATLNAMHGIEYEVGARGQHDLPAAIGSWDWSIAAYYSRIKDEILSFGDPGNPATANYDKTLHAGVEALVGASVTVGTSGNYRLEPRISASINDFRFRDDNTYGNNRLPAAASYEIHGELIYRHVSSGVYVGPTFDFVGSRYADMANSYRVGGYELIGLRAGIKRPRWEAFVEATNVANRRFISTVAPTTQAAANARVLNPGAPRGVFAGMRVFY